MASEPQIAFATARHEPPALEIRVNFGVFAGREATAAEIEELARMLLPEVGEVAIVSELRHEMSATVEATLHQVRIEVDGARLPAAAEAIEDLRRRLVDAADRWARTCIAQRHAEISDL